MDQRNSSSNNDRDRAPSPPTNPNVFDDEYALDQDEDDFMPAVSDGFRPAGVSGNEAWDGDRQDHDRSDSQRPPFTTTKSADTDLWRVASRNSTMKTTCVRESISHDSRNPGTHPSHRASLQAIAALQHRASIGSTGSFATMARSDSPSIGGPSHPYGMYPQDTMARSSSVTTSSTQHQPQRSMSLQRPAHPYGMYTQNVVEDEPPMPAVQSSVPVGFPGLSTGYHRRIGPDGEEQDIVGPDGHTEQLPPYSRYPEEGLSKGALATEASPTPVQVPVAAPPTASDDAIRSPVSPLTPTHPTPPQRQESQDQGPPPAAAPPTDGTTSPVSTTMEHVLSEKLETEKSAQNWRSRRLWGKIPIGVALILLALVFIFAIILGAAIGTYVAKNNRGKGGRGGRGGKGDHDEPAPQVTGAGPSLFDASPIPTPPSLAPLPTGDFALPLGFAQESSPSCLTVANQLSAWSCKMTFAPLKLTINTTSTDPQFPRPLAALSAQPRPDGSVQYGVQPPTVNIQPLQLVLDLDYKAYGPAWHFSARYDKLVVLNELEFAAGASLTPAVRKRDEKPPFRHRFQVVPGEYPWFCWWNQTYIEGFVYAEDNSTAATFTNFPTAWPSNPYGSSLPVETPPPVTPTDSAAPANADVTPVPTPAPFMRRGDDDFIRYPPYPRIVKIEERRLPGATQPYCEKMRLLEDGTMAQAVDGEDNPIVVHLQEDDPTLQEFIQAGAGPPPEEAAPSSSNTSPNKRRQLDKRTDPAGACHCQWMFQ